MQADRNAPVPSKNGSDQLSGLAALQLECWRLRHEVHSLGDTIAVYRKTATALTLDNAALRSEVAKTRDRVAPRRGSAAVTERVFVIDDQAPSMARAAIIDALADHVTARVLEHAQLVASELASNSVRHSGAPPSTTLTLRIERSETAVRLEIEDPGHGGEITVRRPDVAGGFGLNIVQVLSERWGAERVTAGGTRVWALLSLSPPIDLPRVPLPRTL
jgi:anti-sigma regulatory factor (Ser/Thr protein kinase)